MVEEIKDIGIAGIGSSGEMAEQMKSAGFQASHLGESVQLIGQMNKEKCVIFFAFTANLVASGLRGVIRDLCRAGFVDAIVTTAGAIDHDIIKTEVPYLQGSFNVDDSELHRRGINRVGNIFIPNKGFEFLEKKMQGIFSEVYAKKKTVTPRELAKVIGEKLDESSFLYWCAKNEIPVFCPGVTDGAIGLQMHFFREENKDFVVDPVGDMKELADLVLNAEKTGAIVLGGGISKHHVIGANILREGLDYAVYVSTAPEFDGSLSGAQTHEAKSWGKLKEKGSSVTINADATIAFPLIAAALKEKGIIS
ncbi:MAG: deoxyhypusine synthase [Candidatus Diapherotrites archaeon]